ncbi:MAG: hypothetical protein D8H93_32910 [Capnocytophaga sp.]|nr:MAG: hypothetical protein D8H93_32910 [Capnocytophaga sp.]
MDATKTSILLGVGLFISFALCLLYLLDCTLLESVTLSTIISFLLAITWFKASTYFLHKK